MTELEAAVERVTALSAGNKSWAKHAATSQQSYDLLEDAKAMDRLLHALAEANERASLLHALAEANERASLLHALAEANERASLLHALAEANERASLLQTAVHARCAERDEARKAMKVIHDAAFAVRHAFGGRMSEVSCVFEQIVRVSSMHIAALNPQQEGSRDHGCEPERAEP